MNNIYIDEPIAIIDVGAHFTRLEIFQYSKKNNRWVTLEQLSQIAPLGADVFTTNQISNDNIYLVGQILRDFAKIISEYKVKYVRAFATSAVREAFNKDIFIDRVYKISGIKLKELELATEIKNMYLSIREILKDDSNFNSKNTILVSIGTGIIRTSFIEKGILKYSESAKIGALRIIEELEEFLEYSNSKYTIAPFVDAAIRNLLLFSNIKEPSILIATGSSVRVLLNLIKPKNQKFYTLDKKEFEQIYEKIKKMSIEEMVEIWNVSDFLARSVGPTCLILHMFFKTYTLEQLIIVKTSTRESLMLDFYNHLMKKEDSFENNYYECVKNLGMRYRYDQEHAEKVANLSEFIFDETRFLHNFDKKELKILKTAAYLHDIGYFISTQKHHKNSFYIINNSLIPGLLNKDKQIVALVARYHRKSPPKLSHYEYASLCSENRVIVNVLSAILRIADAIAFIGRGIKNINFVHNKKIMEIVLSDPVDDLVEKWSIKSKITFFTELFGYKIIVSGK